MGFDLYAQCTEIEVSRYCLMFEDELVEMNLFFFYAKTLNLSDCNASTTFCLLFGCLSLYPIILSFSTVML